ncbi:MAG: hypothetical protein MJE66_16350 [Proteobacteria bacterium]|nr:hypothetical protein [Pseudomonadota bacterium]
MARKKDRLKGRFSRGLDLLEAGEVDAAFELGRELEAEGHPEGYELQALAYVRSGELEQALIPLERGIVHEPLAWALHQLRANALSDLGKQYDAVEAFRRALDCPDVDEVAVYYNAAVSLASYGHLEEALERVCFRFPYNEQTRELHVLSGRLRLSMLTHLKRPQAALREARALITRETCFGYLDAACGGLFAEQALAAWAAKRSPEIARESALEAVGLDRSEPVARWVLLELSEPVSPTGSLYRIEISSVRPGGRGESDRRFAASFRVVAECPPEALELVRHFEPAAARESIALAECTALEPAAGRVRGVHTVGPEWCLESEAA